MTFLVVFVLLCGLNIAESHQGGRHSDGFALAANMLVLFALTAVFLLWRTAGAVPVVTHRATTGARFEFRVLARPSSSPPVGAPLRC